MTAATAVGALAAAGVASAAPVQVDFLYNGTDGTDGSAQTWTVPAGVTSATFELWGAAGGDGYAHVVPGGLGAHLVATLPVTPGETLQLRVGSSLLGKGGLGAGADGGGGGAAAGRRH